METEDMTHSLYTGLRETLYVQLKVSSESPESLSVVCVSQSPGWGGWGCDALSLGVGGQHHQLCGVAQPGPAQLLWEKP